MPYKNPEDQKRWAEQNREHRLEYYRQWREQNKEHVLEQKKQYREQNKEKISQAQKDYYQKNKQAIREKSRLDYQENREKHLQRVRKYREDNYEYVQQQAKEYRQRNKHKSNQYQRDRYHSDLQFKMATLLRRRLEKAINKQQKTGSAVHDLGCTIPELIQHIEQQFTEGMSWDNWSHTGWHLDHIKPLSLFDLTDPEQYKQAAHYTNLQPLWAHDNLSKGNRYSPE